MAAGAWQFFDSFKEYMADGTIDLDTDTFDLHLFTSASNAASDDLSSLGSVSNEVASGNGYTQSGRALTQTWAAGASSGELRFDADDEIFSASGGNIANVKFAVIVARTGASGKATANHLVCRSQLSTSQFTVTDGNTLTLAPSANGIFELNG